MIENINIKIEGKVFDGTPVRVLPSGFSIFWDYGQSRAFQKSFYLSLGTSSFGLGTDQFVGNVLTIINSISSRQSFKFNPSTPVSRSRELYGQIKIVDNFGQESLWKTFAMYVNDLPHIVNAEFSSNSNIFNGISLNVIKPSDEVLFKTKWYQNEIIQSYLDDSNFVPSRNIEYGDIWRAEVIPYDDLEYGPVFDVDSISIDNPSITGSDLVILPAIPNPDDILNLQYNLNKNGIYENIGDDSSIDWYVNDVQVEGLSSGSFARLRLRPGDRVRARLNPSWNGYSGSSIFSNTVVVSNYNLIVSNFIIGGGGYNNKVSYDSVNLSWSVPPNLVEFISGFSIKLAHSQGGDSLFSTNVEKSLRNFIIPSSIMDKGLDYSVSLAPIGIDGAVGKYETINFSTQGNAWADNVEAKKGYSVVCNLSCSSISDDQSAVNDVLSFNIADGTNSYVIDIHPTFLRLNLNGSNNIKVNTDFSFERSLLVSVLNNKIFIYLDNAAIISNQTLGAASSDKYFNIVPRGGFGDSESLISFIKISTSGAIHSQDEESSNVYSFSEIIDIKDSSINDVHSSPNGVIVATNDISSNYSKTYLYKPGVGYVDINIKNLNSNAFYVNDVSASPNQKSFAVSTSRGSSIFLGDPAITWDSYAEFRSVTDLVRNQWFLFSSPSDLGVSFSEDGIKLSTLFEDIGRTSSVSENNEYYFSAINIIAKINFYPFTFKIDGGFLYIKNNGPDGTADYLSYAIDLSKYKVSELISYLKSLYATSDELSYIGDLYTIDSINFSSNLPAEDLLNFSETYDSKISISIANSQTSIDPYVDNVQSSVAGGKSFISHSNVGTPWYDYANSDTGYTIEFELKLDYSQDSLRPVNVNAADLLGLYLNDSNFDQRFSFSSNGIYIKNLQKNISLNMNDFVKIRISAKNGICKIWKKEIADNEFVFIDSFKQNEIKDVSRDCRSLKCSSSNGKYYSLWIEDSGDYDVIKYAISSDGLSWSDPQVVPTGFISIKNADIAVDGLGTIFIAYETFYNEHSDVIVLSKNEFGWSSQFNISNDKGSSTDCRIFSDEFNNIHLVWSDSRSGIYEIYYSMFDSKSRKWNVDGFSSTRVTSSSYGAYRPSIFSRAGYAYMSWTDINSNGLSQIRAAYYNFFTKQWVSSYKTGSDFIVSDSSYTKANGSDILSDKDGNVHFVWHDYINDYYRILHRQSSSEISFNELPFLVTSSSEKSNSINPKIGIVDLNGDIILVWNKSLSNNSSTVPLTEIDLADPYSPNVFLYEEQNSYANNNLFAARWIREYRSWASSGSSVVKDGQTFGGLDVSILKDSFEKKFVYIPKYIYNNSVILLGMRDTVSVDAFKNNPFTQVYSLEFDASLGVSEISYGEDPYDNSLISINKPGPLKSLILGDMGDWRGSSLYIKYVKYSITGEKEPFSFRKVGYLTHSMSSDPIIKTLIADNGNAWMANSKYLYFYDYSADQVFNSWDESLFELNNLSLIFENNSYSIYDAELDFYGNIFLIVKINNLYKIIVSKDHIRWFLIEIENYEINSQSNVRISFNENGDMAVVQPNNSCYIKNYISYIRSIANYGNISSSSSSSSSGLPDHILRFVPYLVSLSPSLIGNIEINDVALDEKSNMFVSTDVGLFSGKIDSLVLLTKSDGLNSEIVKFCHLNSNFSRIVTFENSISLMSGTSFENIEINYFPSVMTVDGIVSVSSTNYSFDSGNYIKSINYKNSILVAVKNGLILISDEDPLIRRKVQKSAFFNSESLDFVTPDVSNNIVIKDFTFNLTDSLKNDENINNYLVEILLNNNPINFGYEFSAKEETIIFKTSLLPSDEVKIRLRSDVLIDNDFSQNGAEIQAFGSQTRNVKAVSYSNEQTYALVLGSEDFIAVKDDGVKLPYDEVVLDRVPPDGRVRFVSQTGPDSITISIDPPSDGTYDDISGISSMAISNYDNFTIDGSNAIIPVPFRQVSSHNLISSLNPSSTIIKREDLNYEKLFTFNRDSTVERMYAITSSPIQIFERSTGGVFSENPISVLEDGSSDFVVGFVEKLGNSVVIGTRSLSGLGQGKIFITNDMQSFTIVSLLPGKGATSGFVSSYDRSLYIGVDGSVGISPSGYLVKFDGSSAFVYKSGIDKSVNCISGYDRFIFAGTSDEGKIFRIDLASGVVEIIHVDTVPDILGISTLGTAVFAGSSQKGIVIRANDNDSGFIESFKTTPGNVVLVKTLDILDSGFRVFVAIQGKLYSLRNTWTLEGAADSDIKDVIVDENGNIVYCSLHEIRTARSQTSINRKVFVKLIDNAGNETDIRSSPDEEEPTDGYNDNLTLTLTEDELKSTYLQSKLLEVDNSGEIKYYINGDAPFYSGERVTKEAGTYLSEIFNGTTGHVSWSRISWDGFIPEGSNMKIYIRVADFRSEIDSKPFTFEMDESQNNIDISFLSGQYLQIKVELSTVSDMSPYVSKIVVINNAGTASHFFTTTFPLPSNIKRGIISTEKITPVGSDIIIGISGNEANDFSQYQIVPESRVFSLDQDKQGNRLKIGFRFITPQNPQLIAEGDNLGALPGFGSISSNSVGFNFNNSTGSTRSLDFKIEFFEDQNFTIQKASVDTVSSPNLFRVNGNSFPSSGSLTVPPGFNYKIHCIPIGLPLVCDVDYYVKVSIIENNLVSSLGSSLVFRKLCGINFINNIFFTYVNSSNVLQSLHFDVSFYTDEARTSLFKSYSSILPEGLYSFLADFFPYPTGGLLLQPGESSVISMEFTDTELLKLDPSITYYVTIRYVNMLDQISSPSVESMNYTFRAVHVDSNVVCGSESGVPVLQGFAFMFELEDGSLIKFNYIS